MQQELSGIKDVRVSLEMTISQLKQQVDDGERDRRQQELDQERTRGEIDLLNGKISSLEEQLRTMTNNYNSSQNEVRDARNSLVQLEITLQKVQSELSEAAMYKDMYTKI